MSRQISRHRTALVRSELSRPLRLALNDGVLSQTTSIMDYGCGRGGDVARLAAAGFDCSGWDPVHAPDGVRRKADLVNLGYVVNVIERPLERQEVLRTAWGLTHRLLVVSARLTGETTDLTGAHAYADGLLTRRGTFQKFFDQQELRTWIDHTLGVASVAAAPGVFYVFRDPVERSTFAANRLRRVAATPRLRISDQLIATHRELLQEVADFIAARGRLPAAEEFPTYAKVVDALGSFRRAFRLLRQMADTGAWEGVQLARSQELLIFLALSRFESRPKFSELANDLQLDVRAFFGSYAAACTAADDLLFSLGRAESRREAQQAAEVGKKMPTALYVHLDAIPHLPTLLRLYEGCARVYVGRAPGANVVKLGRDEPKVSYLAYPDFERDPHPALLESTQIHLQTFRMRQRRYDPTGNPPILHRKEEFVAGDHPLRSKFARLTQQEENHGLFADPAAIGTRDGWSTVLANSGWILAGHRLLRRRSPPATAPVTACYGAGHRLLRRRSPPATA